VPERSSSPGSGSLSAFGGQRRLRDRPPPRAHDRRAGHPPCPWSSGRLMPAAQASDLRRGGASSTERRAGRRGGLHQVQPLGTAYPRYVRRSRSPEPLRGESSHRSGPALSGPSWARLSRAAVRPPTWQHHRKLAAFSDVRRGRPCPAAILKRQAVRVPERGRNKPSSPPKVSVDEIAAGPWSRSRPWGPPAGGSSTSTRAAATISPGLGLATSPDDAWRLALLLISCPHDRGVQHLQRTTPHDPFIRSAVECCERLGPDRALPKKAR
jgi:hypothetical protein